MPASSAESVYIDVNLLDALCELAGDRDPEAVTVPLAVTPSDELEESVATESPVFTHFYLPETGQSVRAVFGVDLGTPSGSTPGVFLSHPDGRLEVTKRDNLREVVLVAVPPWRPDEVAAFDRRGRERKMRAIEVTVPEESPP